MLVVDRAPRARRVRTALQLECNHIPIQGDGHPLATHPLEDLHRCTQGYLDTVQRERKQTRHFHTKQGKQEPL